MRILTDCSFLSEKQIAKIGERYGARYVFETQLRLRSEKWSDFSSAVFYTEAPHPEGSNWFGIWNNGGRFMISNAISAVEEPFFGALAENGDVIYLSLSEIRSENICDAVRRELAWNGWLQPAVRLVILAHPSPRRDASERHCSNPCKKAEFGADAARQ